jgi:hypothetical protein
MNTHLVEKLVEAQVFVDVLGGETLTSSALP